MKDMLLPQQQDRRQKLRCFFYRDGGLGQLSQSGYCLKKQPDGAETLELKYLRKHTVPPT